MVVAGLLVAIAAVVLKLDPFVVLGGVMLAISGIVKMVILHLWRELVPTQQASSSRGRRNS